jgi:hypothetical protein
MICRGSVSGPVQTLEKFGFGSGSGNGQYLAQFSNNKNFLQDLALFNVRSSIFPQKVGLSFLIF